MRLKLHLPTAKSAECIKASRRAEPGENQSKDRLLERLNRGTGVSSPRNGTRVSRLRERGLIIVSGAGG